MLITLLWLISLMIIYFSVCPLIIYVRDKKGFRKYPSQNCSSGITALAYGWEVGRVHQAFHTRRLHEALIKQPIVRLGHIWLSFGNSHAVFDIYGYNSPCDKGVVYTSLQGGGRNLVKIDDR